MAAHLLHSVVEKSGWVVGNSLKWRLIAKKVLGEKRGPSRPSEFEIECLKLTCSSNVVILDGIRKRQLQLLSLLLHMSLDWGQTPFGFGSNY